MTSGRAGACSAESLRLAEPLAGTASAVRGYLLVEHGGPWAAKAVEGATFGPGAPADLGRQLAAAVQPHGVTPLLVRRHGAPPGVPAQPFVAVVALDEAGGGRGAWRRVDDVREIPGWDVGSLLAQLRARGVPEAWEPLLAQYLVCTHGRRDVCCAELGRPLAGALDALAPGRVWEVSHVGGHRLAPNVVALPQGVVYGRVPAARAAELLRAHDDGRVLVDLLRGRSALSPSLQVAEVAVRRAAEAPVLDAVRLREATSDGAMSDGVGRTVSTWSVGDAVWRVVVDTADGDGEHRPASCGAELGAPPAVHTVVELTDVDPPAGVLWR